ncbi:MAG: thioredoxin-dependent thiol peroxidase [Pseudarcicella sp.]|nr:thioredoxin-dependent thiol peroxidase [Pseudarcicella sp.]MBP6410645.1 thioredoxin-dependent thiol peroxidase [Pseudarcicella sp.]
MTLKIGDKAPLFSQKNQFGELISLADFLGNKKVVLYFYPKDNTPGCTAQACDLNDNLEKLTQQGFEIIGVSTDSVKSHKKFVDKFDLKFNLLADEEQQMVNQYGVWVEKSMYGKTYMGIARTTFIIDTEGTITDIIEKVNTKSHTEQII